MQNLPGSLWQALTEVNITGRQRGFGRLGGDCWQAIKDKNGRRVGWLHERYPWSNWWTLNMRCTVLAPGPEGAVATHRFEQFREGVQQSEARTPRVLLPTRRNDVNWRRPGSRGPRWTNAFTTAAVTKYDRPGGIARAGETGHAGFQAPPAGAERYASPWPAREKRLAAK
jgi:hypothetical protein